MKVKWRKISNVFQTLKTFEIRCILSFGHYLLIRFSFSNLLLLHFPIHYIDFFLPLSLCSLDIISSYEDLWNLLWEKIIRFCQLNNSCLFLKDTQNKLWLAKYDLLKTTVALYVLSIMSTSCQKEWLYEENASPIVNVVCNIYAG